jgi:CDGSH-type Zn-finger protein
MRDNDGGDCTHSSEMMDDTNPTALVPGPYRITLKSGKRYQWCACGRSHRQPLCDASHEGTAFEPIIFQPAEDITVALCGCKLTRNPPFCDGTHVSGFRNADGVVVHKNSR